MVNTSQLALDVSSSTASGSVDATAAGSTLVAGLAVDVNVTGAVADGSTYSIIKSNGVETGGQTVTDNSAVLSFTSTSVGNNIVLTASRSGTTYEDLASGGNASAAGSALETNLADNPTGDMLDVLNIIDVLSASEIETAMDTVSPDISAGAMDGSLEALNQSLGTVTAHLSSARSGNTGVSTGDGIEGFEEKDIWIKGFGNFSDQGTRSGIQGYESYTYGTTLGFDVLAAENVTLGISGGYAYTEVDPKKATLNNTDIDSYQGTLYGSFDGGPYYIDTVFAFAWNGYEGSRKIDLGDTSRTAKSDYDGQQYSGYVGGGYTFEEEGFEITPIASLQYTRLHIGDYTETGAGSLNLKISDQDYDVLESGLGLKIAYPIKEKSMTIIPEIHSSWYYDFIGDKAQTTSKFTGGGASFETNGADPAQHSFDVGAQLTLLTQKNISLILNYDLELKEDFSAHSGAVTVKYDF
ncbi:MAG: autotransporter outer membrane beta-barrel domain-containing protein [Candidatus Omnitrophota bacterium]